jgi:hypothetical protein
MTLAKQSAENVEAQRRAQGSREEISIIRRRVRELKVKQEKESEVDTIDKEDD